VWRLEVALDSAEHVPGRASARTAFFLKADEGDERWIRADAKAGASLLRILRQPKRSHDCGPSEMTKLTKFHMTPPSERIVRQSNQAVIFLPQRFGNENGSSGSLLASMAGSVRASRVASTPDFYVILNGCPTPVRESLLWGE